MIDFFCFLAANASNSFNFFSSSSLAWAILTLVAILVEIGTASIVSLWFIPGTIVALILSVIIGVAAGTILSVVMELTGMINEGLLPGYATGDIPQLFLDNMANNPAFSSIVYQNFFQGLLFAAIGVVFFISQAAKKVSSPKMTELK